MVCAIGRAGCPRREGWGGGGGALLLSRGLYVLGVVLVMVVVVLVVKLVALVVVGRTAVHGPDRGRVRSDPIRDSLRPSPAYPIRPDPIRPDPARETLKSS